MKDVRLGESLWVQWDGEGYFSEFNTDLIFYTTEHVESGNDLVVRALASTLQRDGIADSLADGFRLVEHGYWEFGYAGHLEGESQITVCDEDGETEYGDIVEEVIHTTWVEIIKN